MQANNAAQRENLLLNLGLNVVAPALVLSKLSGVDALGPVLALLVALALPLGYGVWDFVKRRKYNLFSVIGLVSVALTGGISLLHLPPAYLAVKEAAVPGVLGLAVLLSLRTRWPLVRGLLFNEAVLDTARIERELTARAATSAFEQVMARATWLLAGSFFLSSALNYLLASTVVTAAAGSVEYNEQLGKLTALSYPVIALPATLVTAGALFYLFRRLTQLTGLTFEELLHAPAKPAEDQGADRCGM